MPSRTPVSRASRFLAASLLIVLALGVSASSIMVWRARVETLSRILPEVRAMNLPLSLSDFSSRQLDILLRVEDPSFYTHGGVDLLTPGAGITTVTQGLVKKLYFEHFTPGLAKFRQTLIAAFVLDDLMPKDEQLRLFVNIVPLGRSARGLEEGAHVYFGVSFSKLTEEQYISLVSMIIAPEVFDPIQHPDWSAERVARIHRLLNGEYKPRGLMDLYYGELSLEAQAHLPPFSYFPSYYR